jgi:hypothetical protein
LNSLYVAVMGGSMKLALVLMLGAVLGAPAVGFTQPITAEQAAPHPSRHVDRDDRVDNSGDRGDRGAAERCQDRHDKSSGPDRQPDSDDQGDARARALASWRALERCFGYVGPGYDGVFANHLADANGKVQPGFVWGQATVVHAALVVSSLRGDTRDLDLTGPTLERYLLTKPCYPDGRVATGWAPELDARKLNPPPVRWWDDDGWTALVLLEAERRTPGRGYLQEVKQVFPFLQCGQWQRGEWGGGGQRENEDPSVQVLATVATDLDDKTAELLHLATTAQNDPNHDAYLEFATKNVTAIKRRLRALNGLYWDGYYPDINTAPWKWCAGTLSADKKTCSGQWFACNPNRPDLPPTDLPPDPHICGWRFNDNQAVMAASDVLLYRISCQTKCQDDYLESATKTADAALNYYEQPKWLWVNVPVENAQYFESLFELDRVRHDPRIRAQLKAYLDRAWAEARDPETGLFDRGGIASLNHGKPDSIDQAAFVIMYGMLAEHPE